MGWHISSAPGESFLLPNYYYYFGLNNYLVDGVSVSGSGVAQTGTGRFSRHVGCGVWGAKSGRGARCTLHAVATLPASERVGGKEGCQLEASVGYSAGLGGEEEGKAVVWTSLSLPQTHSQ
jgi:hypothetical protein